MKKYHSIYNHTLAPVTAGPSSSGTAAPYRIGRLCRELLGAVPVRAEIELAAASGYSKTYMGMRSDLAIINGLLGKSITDSSLEKAYADAEKHGLKLKFDLESWDGTGLLEGSRIHLTGEGGESCRVTADSIGGGAIVISEIDGFPVHISGEYFELLVYTKALTDGDLDNGVLRLEQEAERFDEIYTVENDEGGKLMNLKSSIPFSPALLIKICRLPWVDRVRALGPVYAIVIPVEAQPPFCSAEELLNYTEKNEFTLLQAALKYESALSGWTEAEVLQYGRTLWETVKASIDKGMEGSFDINGIVTPKADQLAQRFGKTGLLPMGVLDTALPVALGIMEYGNASGTLVCIPTGGSSGIVPGAIYAAGLQLQATENQMVEALIAAGLIGVCMAEDNNFSGCELGCQAEVACAAAMAAGALVYMLGGGARQSFDAASLAIQCLLGLICDPVAGLVQVPCLARNMSSTAIAVMSANAVLAGFDPVIPFSEMNEALKATGKKISSCYEQGAAETPTGRRLRKEQELRNMKLRRLQLRGENTEG